jgi:hypothetical protein
MWDYLLTLEAYQIYHHLIGGNLDFNHDNLKCIVDNSREY